MRVQGEIGGVRVQGWIDHRFEDRGTKSPAGSNPITGSRSRPMHN
jgi:hypothetical protein